MRQANHQPAPENTEFTDVLKTWQAPETPPALDQNVLASYRQQIARVPFWKRFFTSSIQIPMPIFAAQLLLFVIAGGALFAFVRTTAPVVIQSSQVSEKTKIIEVPVASEKTVQRVSNPEKKRFALAVVKSHSRPVSLPATTVINAAPAPIGEISGLQFRNGTPLTRTPITPEIFDPINPNTTEYKINLIPTVVFNNKTNEQSKSDFTTLLPGDFLTVANHDKVKLADGRFSRTITRASGWVTKPIEKGVNLYHAIPRAIPAFNSFVIPAKDTCLAPFRAKPTSVNLN